ncbi:MAG TPA: hypothetical protein VHX37_09775 [Acidobacteriaceae bacterium]|jgi:hypothetical protein|nr:hypothetical protein [Acidobacteriaceae bacterium]
MDYLPRLVRLLGLCLLALLLVYWIVFAGYTMVELLRGGPHAVVAWYAHVIIEGSFLSQPRAWSPMRFLLRQLVLLAVTAGLWIAVRPCSVFFPKHQLEAAQHRGR